jgi:uncharacterized protein with FMN-binding domain
VEWNRIIFGEDAIFLFYNYAQQLARALLPVSTSTTYDVVSGSTSQHHAILKSLQVSLF